MTPGTGQRKLRMLERGLGALLILGGLTLAGLPGDALAELAWPTALLTAAALGANVGEHWTRGGAP